MSSFARKPSSGIGPDRHHPHTLSTLVCILLSFFVTIFNLSMQDFQGASSAAAAKAMKSELSKLAAQIQDEGERKVSSH